MGRNAKTEGVFLSHEFGLNTDSQILKALHESTALVLLVNDNTRVVYANEAAMVKLGYCGAELSTLPVAELIPAWNSTHPQERGSSVIEAVCRCRNGARLAVELHTSRIDHNGHPCTLAMAYDIAARKQAEQHLLESHAQLRELATQADLSRERERKWIAREIHDEMGQMLTTLKLGLSTLEMQFGVQNPQLAARIRSLAALSEQCTRLARDVTEGLRPPSLDFGIVTALEWLADKYQQHTDMRCIVSFSDRDLNYNENRATVIFRVVQEALTNAMRHANANKVEILVDQREDGDVIEVSDNGRGFDPAVPTKRFGLLGMRERVVSLGGELALVSAPGHGTCVTVKLPPQAAHPLAQSRAPHY